MESIDRVSLSRELKREAKIFLDRYSYEEIIEACECGNGEPVLMEYLHNIFVSIIEDWIQDYVDKRKRRHLRHLRKLMDRSGECELDDSVDVISKMMASIQVVQYQK